MEPRCSTNLEARCSRDKSLGRGRHEGRKREKSWNVSVGWRPAYLLSARLLKIELLVSCSPTINRGTKCRRGWRDTIDRVKKKKKTRKRGRFFEKKWFDRYDGVDEDYLYFRWKRLFNCHSLFSFFRNSDVPYFITTQSFGIFSSIESNRGEKV